MAEPESPGRDAGPATAPSSAAPASLPPSGLSALRRPPRADTRRRGRRRWAIGAVAALALAAAAWWAWPRVPSVEVATVQPAWPSQQYTQLSASGYVVAQRRAAVSSKATGRLVELHVREGSRVRQGELIARLDAADVSASLGVAQAGERQARAAAGQAEANLVLARAQQALAEQELQRTLGLSGQGFVSTQAVDAAQTRARTAAASTAAARAAVATARAAVGQAQAQVGVARVNRDSTEIRAPFDGVVLVKNANVGDLITPFSNAAGTSGAVVTLADLSTLEVEADVSESSVGKVAVDQPVEITLDALPELRLAGSVARIVPTVDRAKATVMTKIRFERMDPRVLPEMSAKVSFLSQAPGANERQPVLAVPPGALAEREGRTVLLRVGQDGRVQALPVTAGRRLGEAVEVSGAGLQRGDRVVLAPPPGLGDGQAVRVAGR